MGGFDGAPKHLGWRRVFALFPAAPSGLRRASRVRLAALGIPICEVRIVRLEGRNGRLRRVHLADDSSVAREALFFTNGFEQSTELARGFHCAFTRSGVVRTGRGEATGTPGLYVAGDASQDSQFVVVAAAEGVRAAVRIHQELAAADEARRLAGRPARS
jgi:thioredoxin reductase